MPSLPTNGTSFSDAEVLEIRREASLKTLDVRAWSNFKRCSPETIRRVARKDTYRNVEESAGQADPNTPSDAEVASSLARLVRAADEVPLTPRATDSILDEIMKRGTP